MGVVNTKSVSVTNADATPAALSDRCYTGAPVYVAIDKVAVAAADDDTSVFRFFRVRSDIRIFSFKVFCDALTSGTDWDLGVYQTAANGGAVVEVDVFADAQSLATAITTGTEIRFHDTTNAPIQDVDMQLWEVLGLSSDPGIEYDICLTANTIGSAAGDVVLHMFYQG
jgi:hypothetical protein